MKKQVATISVVLLLAIALSLSFVSAGFFDDLFGKITGKQTSNSCSNPDTWYKDWDEDGYYVDTQESCNDPSGQEKKWTNNSTTGKNWKVVGAGDCVDDPAYGTDDHPRVDFDDWKFNLVNTDPGDNMIADNINPGEKEVCNFVDDNCDGNIDEGYNKTQIFFDNDSDGYVNKTLNTTMCGTGYDFTTANYSDSNSSMWPNSYNLYNLVREGRIIDTVAHYSIGPPGNLPPNNTFYLDNSNRLSSINYSFWESSSHKGLDCNDSDPMLNTTKTWYKDDDQDNYIGKKKQSCGNPATNQPKHNHKSTSKPNWYLKDRTYDNSGKQGTLIHSLFYGTVDCNDNDDDILNRKDWYLDNDSDGYWSNKTKKCYNPADQSKGSNSGSGWFNSTSESENNHRDLVSGGDCLESNYATPYMKNSTLGKNAHPGKKDTCDFSGYRFRYTSSNVIKMRGSGTYVYSVNLSGVRSLTDTYQLDDILATVNIKDLALAKKGRQVKHKTANYASQTRNYLAFGPYISRTNIPAHLKWDKGHIIIRPKNNVPAFPVDNDCDSSLDESNDTDGDTFTTCGTRTIGLQGAKEGNKLFNFTSGHSPTDNFTSNGVTGWECNDNEASVHRGETEMCDTLDHDCDGDIYNFSWPDDGTVNKDLRGSPKEACTADGKAVNEYYCDTNEAEIVSNGLMSCTKGDGCYAGACRSCFSTDLSDVDSAQENITEKGITWNNTYDIVGPAGEPEGLEDTCKDTDTLIEYSCSSSQGSNIDRTSLQCSNQFNESWSCVLGECVCNPDYKLIPGSCGSDGKGTYEDVNNCYNWSSTSYPKTKEGYCSKTGIVNDQDIDSLKIAGQPFDSSKDYSDSGVKSVMVNKSGNIARFDWNFSRILDLRSANIEVSDEDSDQGYLVINGLHVGKTVNIERVAETDQVCLEDSIEVEDVDDLSDGCNEDGEILIDCPGSNSGYSCNIVNGGSQYEVSSLRHSGVKEFLNKTADDEDIFDNSGGLTGDFDSGDSSQNLSKCTRRNYKCTGWSNCDGGVMTRNCQKVENCRGGVSRPETSQSCGVQGAVEQVTGKEEGFPWKFVLIFVGGLVIVLTIAIILVNMKSGSSSSKSRKSSSSSSSSSSTSGRNLTSSSSSSSSSNSSSSNHFSGSSNSSSSSSNKNKGYFKRGISRKYQQRGRG